MNEQSQNEINRELIDQLRAELQQSREALSELAPLRARAQDLEKELRETRERHQTLLDELLDIVYEVDLEGRVCYANAAAERILGYDRQDSLGKPFLSWIAEDRIEETRKNHERICQGEQFIGYTVLVDRQGHRHEVEYVSSPVIENGAVVGTRGVVRDITQRQQALQQLQQANARYRELFQGMRSGVAVYEVIGEGSDFVLKDINPAGEAIARIKKLDILNRSVTEIFPGVTKTGILDVFREACRTGQVKFFPPHLYEDGRIQVWTEDTVFPLPSGELIQIHRDVTESIQTQQALQESEQTYRTLVESAAEDICILDARGTVLFANRQVGNYFKVPGEALVGKTLWDLVPKPIAETKMKIIRQVIESGQRQTVTMPSEINGHHIWVHANVVPLHQGPDQARTVMVVARNITELKKTQEQLQIYHEQLNKAERLASAGLLSAMVAHELAQPLTVIKLTLQNTLSELAEQGNQVQYTDLTECLLQTRHLEDLAKRFRQFAKSSRDNRCETICLKSTLRKTVRLMQGLCQRHQVTIELTGIDHVGPLVFNRGDLEQLCFIFIENCLHAANPERENRLEIACGTKNNDTLVLQFADNCGGIAPEHIDHVFEPFFTTKPRSQGTGLGLCVAKRIVTEAQGALHIDNRPGEGVTFRISLPL
jgi:PAS domain S-box-containing protein